MEHRAIIAQWPSARTLATDIGAKYEAVKKWRQAGIPSRYWTTIIAMGKERGFGLKADDFLTAQSADSNDPASENGTRRRSLGADIKAATKAAKHRRRK